MSGAEQPHSPPDPAPDKRPSTRPPQPPPARFPTIGLAGGIGSGKSAVARLLQARGAIVSDSDTQARELLRDHAIAGVLTRWWGTSILGPDRLPDRANIAALVFADPAKRHRLEALIHPILHSQRKAALLEARKATPQPPIFVIDAPLLFEAGLDKECDAVIFVDALRDIRLARLARTRHWDDAELIRREAAQLPLAAKRSRSTFVIDNSAAGAARAEPAGDAAVAAHLNKQIDDLWPRLVAIKPGTPRRA